MSLKSDWIPSAPITVNWAITNRCNFMCRHCYSRSDANQELSFEGLCALLRKLSDARVFSVNFGGGEPLMRKDIFDLAARASELGLAVSMNSNGFLIDKGIAQQLKDAGFRKVGVSIDSPVPEVHDEFRGIKGSHGRATTALKNLKDAGIEISISSVICKINVKDIEGLIKQALSLGVDSLNFHNFKCSGLGFTNRDALDLSPEEWRDFYVYAIGQREKIKGIHISLEDPIIASLDPKNGESLVKGSVCGKLSLNIKANGDITPCGFIPIVIGNLCNDDLLTIWSDSPVLESVRNKTPKGKCLACGHYSECLGGCTARAFALTGDINSPDPHCWINES